MDSFSVDPKILNLIWESSPIIIALIGKNGKFLYANHMAQHFWEYTQTELREKTWMDITHPEDEPADRAMRQYLLNEDIPHYTMCKRYITKSGKVVWASLTVHLLKDDAGGFLYFLSQVVPLDMMQHIGKEQLEKLSESNKRIAEDFSSPFKRFLKSNWKWGITTLTVVTLAIFSFVSDVKINNSKVVGLEKRMEKIENILMEMREDHKKSVEMEKKENEK